MILPGVDEELDHMKQTFEALNPLLGEVARKLSENVPIDVQGTLNVIYFPQIGFLLTIPLDPVTKAAMYDGGLENPWERMFSTEYETLGIVIEANLAQRACILQEQRNERNG